MSMRPQVIPAGHGTIERVDPRSVREAVVDLFWEHRHWPRNTHGEYLRLWDWRYHALADGDPFVWVARDAGALIGHIALFPRRFRIGDVELRGAVSGDLLVHRDRRNGPLAIQLLSISHRLLNERVLDFVYTLPNVASYRLATHLGYRDLGPLDDHLDLRRAGPVLARRFSSRIAVSVLSLFAGTGWTLRRTLRQRRMRDAARRYRIEALTSVDPARLERRGWAYDAGRLVPADSSEYVVRRFLRDPFNRRWLFALTDRETGRFEGQVVVEFRERRAVVCDCQVNSAALGEAAAIALTARHLPTDTEVLSVPTLSHTRLSADLRALGFHRRAPSEPFAQGVRLTAFWSPQHPQAANLARAARWSVYTGAADA